MSVFDDFRRAADPQKAARMSAYMRGQFPFLGGSCPERKKLSADFLRGAAERPLDWGFVGKCWAEPEREFQYLGADYLLRVKSALAASDMKNLRRLITEKPWWDTADSLNKIVGDIALRFPGANKTILKWSRGENVWLRRVAITHQLARKGKTDEALLAETIKSSFGQTDFFVNKAIGWSLREYGKTSPGWVRRFIARHKNEMATLSLREAGKYI